MYDITHNGSGFLNKWKFFVWLFGIAFWIVKLFAFHFYLFCLHVKILADSVILFLLFLNIFVGYFKRILWPIVFLDTILPQPSEYLTLLIIFERNLSPRQIVNNSMRLNFVSWYFSRTSIDIFFKIYNLWKTDSK